MGVFDKIKNIFFEEEYVEVEEEEKKPKKEKVTVAKKIDLPEIKKEPKREKVVEQFEEEKPEEEVVEPKVENKFKFPMTLEEVIICLFKLDSSITSPSAIVILVKPLLTKASKA